MRTGIERIELKQPDTYFFIISLSQWRSWSQAKLDLKTNEDWILLKVRQHERLFGVLLAHEVETANNLAASEAEGESCTAAWESELCGAAQTLLHQHAVQSDMSALQAAIARFAAACRLNSDAPLDPK